MHLSSIICFLLLLFQCIASRSSAFRYRIYDIWRHLLLSHPPIMVMSKRWETMCRLLKYWLRIFLVLSKIFIYLLSILMQVSFIIPDFHLRIFMVLNCKAGSEGRSASTSRFWRWKWRESCPKLLSCQLADWGNAESNCLPDVVAPCIC